jgi:chitin disaccharide deacetylase
VRLILHADDFGSSSDTVRATIECFEQGALTSASIMAGMPATAQATEYARAHPELDFGVHLTFVGGDDERPLSVPSEIPALTTSEGDFRQTRQLRVRALLHRLPVEQIERELVCQVEAVQHAGVEITHVDSHRHMHKLPSFRQALERALPRLGIRRVRAVQDVYLKKPIASPTYWLGPRWARRLASAFATTDHFFMPTSAGDKGWEHALFEAVRRLRGQTLEVGVHPGFESWRDQERTSLVSFAALARDGGHELVAWKDIA